MQAQQTYRITNWLGTVSYTVGIKPLMCLSDKQKHAAVRQMQEHYHKQYLFVVNAFFEGCMDEVQVDVLQP